MITFTGRVLYYTDSKYLQEDNKKFTFLLFTLSLHNHAYFTTNCHADNFKNQGDSRTSRSFPFIITQCPLGIIYKL